MSTLSLLESTVSVIFELAHCNESAIAIPHQYTHTHTHTRHWVPAPDTDYLTGATGRQQLLTLTHTLSLSLRLVKEVLN